MHGHHVVWIATSVHVRRIGSSTWWHAHHVMMRIRWHSALSCCVIAAIVVIAIALGIRLVIIIVVGGFVVTHVFLVTIESINQSMNRKHYQY